jgi:hypothetical protein
MIGHLIMRCIILHLVKIWEVSVLFFMYIMNWAIWLGGVSRGMVSNEYRQSRTYDIYILHLCRSANLGMLVLLLCLTILM